MRLDKRPLALTRFLGAFLEKLSVASFAVGMFQGQMAGLFVGAATLVAAGIITWILEEDE